MTVRIVRGSVVRLYMIDYSHGLNEMSIFIPYYTSATQMISTVTVAYLWVFPNIVPYLRRNMPFRVMGYTTASASPMQVGLMKRSQAPTFFKYEADEVDENGESVFHYDVFGWIEPRVVLESLDITPDSPFDGDIVVVGDPAAITGLCAATQMGERFEHFVEDKVEDLQKIVRRPGGDGVTIKGRGDATSAWEKWPRHLGRMTEYFSIGHPDNVEVLPDTEEEGDGLPMESMITLRNFLYHPSNCFFQIV